ncbi:MAG: biliverdin-producing heme oxygenase [Gemmataceae bacterium]|nr:biliverdin-producing heme oxygenase [Gemmataceae bacterium]
MDIATRLRVAMGATHSAIEQLPVSKALVAGTVGRDEYRALLSQLLLVHEALEDELSACPDAAGFLTPDMMRADALRGDLVALGAESVDPPFGETLRLAELMHAWAAVTPWKLIGALYIFEGSRMGSMFLVKPVARALGVPVQPGYGVDYHLDGLATRPQTWARFKVGLAQLPFTAEQWDEVVSAAEETMNALFDLYAAMADHSACVLTA